MAALDPRARQSHWDARRRRPPRPTRICQPRSAQRAPRPLSARPGCFVRKRGVASGRASATPTRTVVLRGGRLTATFPALVRRASPMSIVRRTRRCASRSGRAARIAASVASETRATVRAAVGAASPVFHSPIPAARVCPQTVSTIARGLAAPPASTSTPSCAWAREPPARRPSTTSALA